MFCDSLWKSFFDIHSSQKDGSTSLYVAAREGHVEIVRLLLDRGANKEAANRVR